MKEICGVTFHSDYDKFTITNQDVDRMKLKLYNALLQGKYYKIWTALEKGGEPIEEYTLDNKDVMYLVGLGETVENEEPEDTKNINELLELSYVWLDGFKEEHEGDCTSQPFTCTRCYVERHLGIDTTKRKKH